MARPLRIKFEDAFYHITARGNGKRKIFLSNADREKFKGYLKDVQERYQFILHAYVLMGTHVHLIGQTPLANLSQVMHYVNGSYTTYFNRKRQRSGHLFRGRFKSIVIDKDAYLLELSRYIHLNPIRAHIVERPEDYPYSSYGAYINPDREDIVSTDLILSMVSTNRKESPLHYRRFVEEAMDEDTSNPLQKTYRGMMLGTPSFIKNVLRGLDGKTQNDDISSRRLLAPLTLKDLAEIIGEALGTPPDEVRSGMHRNMAIYCARSFTGCTNREIGRYFGAISYSAVTKAKDRFEKVLLSDRTMRRIFEKIRGGISRFKG